MSESYDLLLADRTRVRLGSSTTLGRAADNTVQLTGRGVSRRHARITLEERGPVLDDAGSRYGTWVDGRRVTAPVRLRDGALIRLGDEELVLARRRGENESALTIVVPERAAGDAAYATSATDRPRLRPGHAIKRLDASERPYRWVLRDLRSDRFMRLSDEDGRLLALIDGRHSVIDLLAMAEERFGGNAPARLAALLPELAGRGFLGDGRDADTGDAPAPGVARRLMAPREKVWTGAGEWFEALYRDGGWVLLTPVALTVLALVAVAGLMAFAYLVVGRYGTPFIVASKIGLGGLVFFVGRLAVAAVHETAHGLVMASFGRRAGRAGVKSILIFPYVFVDTSEMWFERRSRRIAVTAAGPASDAILGAVFALSCLVLAPGALRDIFFQLAFAAYVGALVNLNPLVDRDGYHILVAALREPNLRGRSRAELRRWLAREGGAPPSRVLVRFAIAGVCWSLVAACIAAVMSLRYVPELRAVLPDAFVLAGLASVWAAVLAPVVITLAPPLLERARRGRVAT